MSEEIKKAYKLFNREDLIDDGYERDLDSNIQVFLTTKQMINYIILQQKVEQLENIIKEAIEYVKEYGFYSNEDDLLNILNKGSESNERD